MADDWDRAAALDDAKARAALLKARRGARRAIDGCAIVPGLALGKIADAIEMILLAKLSGQATERDYQLWAAAGDLLCEAMHVLPVDAEDEDNLRRLILACGESLEA